MTGLTNTTGYKSFTATAVALAANVRVGVNSSGVIAVAGATDNWIGTTTAAVAASGTGTVRLRNAPGTCVFTASAAITAGAQLYPTAAGKVDDASASGAPAMAWTALEAATADGDQIQCAPYAGGNITGSEFVMQFPFNLAAIANGDLVTDLPLTFPGTITQLEFRVTTLVSTGAKASTLNLEINTTNLTGGAVALTSANCNAVGNVVAGSAVTAANTFVAGDTLSIEASSTTTFIEGVGILLVHIVPA